MCGIAGSVVFKLPYVTVTDSMLHCGPDTQYGFTKDNADLFISGFLLRILLTESRQCCLPAHHYLQRG
jgi:hypothetical protein